MNRNSTESLSETSTELPTETSRKQAILQIVEVHYSWSHLNGVFILHPAQMVPLKAVFLLVRRI